MVRRESMQEIVVYCDESIKKGKDYNHVLMHILHWILMYKHIMLLFN